jgi:hypothetical protein
MKNGGGAWNPTQQINQINPLATVRSAGLLNIYRGCRWVQMQLHNDSCLLRRIHSTEDAALDTSRPKAICHLAALSCDAREE